MFVVIEMKEKIISKVKKVMIPIFLSVICGSICGNVVYNIYADKANYELSNSKVYLVQVGAYSSIDNMKVNTMASNYVYYEDDGMYKAIIGITKDYDNVERIKSLYNGDTIVNEYYLSDKNISDELGKLDDELKEESDDDKARVIIDDMLNIYKENEGVKLVKVNEK